MSDNPQPTPGRDTTVREAIAQAVQDNTGTPVTYEQLSVRDRKFVDALEQILTAEQTKILNRLKAKQSTCYDCTHDDYPSGETVNFIDVSAIDAELQQLRAGHGADGGME